MDGLSLSITDAAIEFVIWHAASTQHRHLIDYSSDPSKWNKNKTVIPKTGRQEQESDRWTDGASIS